MPFLGVLPQRQHLFQPQPLRPLAVSDAQAWRLNPAHRTVYNKLDLALHQGLLAAPCGLAPAEFGLAPQARVFVKPIINLAGMGLAARACRADDLPGDPGLFWCEALSGEHLSSDALLHDGEVLWTAHTRASTEKDQARPLYWEIGVTVPAAREAAVRGLLERLLPGYTGLCNVEHLGAHAIEIHLRGSNGFFDFYGPRFIPAWVELVDHGRWQDPGPIPGGVLASWFGDGEPPAGAAAIAAGHGIRLQPDPHTPGRIAILRGPALAPTLATLAALRGDRNIDPGPPRGTTQ